jgi:cell shape-determining protein MreC
MTELISMLLVVLSLLASGLGAAAVWMLSVLRDGIRELRRELSSIRTEYISRVEFELTLKELKTTIEGLRQSMRPRARIRPDDDPL